MTDKTKSRHQTKTPHSTTPSAHHNITPQRITSHNHSTTASYAAPQRIPQHKTASQSHKQHQHSTLPQAQHHSHNITELQQTYTESEHYNVTIGWHRSIQCCDRSVTKTTWQAAPQRGIRHHLPVSKQHTSRSAASFHCITTFTASRCHSVIAAPHKGDSNSTLDNPCDLGRN
jgi:hypothetical protein